MRDPEHSQGNRSCAQYRRPPGVALVPPSSPSARERWLAGVLTEHTADMSEREGVVRAVRIALALACLLAAGCAGVKQAQQQQPVPSSPPVAPATASVPPAPAVGTTPAVVEAPHARETPVQPSQIEPALPPEPVPAVRAVVPKEPTTTRTVTQTAAPQAPAVVAAAPVPATQVPKTASALAVSKPLAPPLDLKSLETRLRQTKAIGVLTKLSLKNQVDDLVNRFRAYHKRQATTTLAELRRSYDMLLLKVLSLLQDSDAPLARDIVKSRAAIWGILEDPKKFTESNLMAGVTP